MKVQVMKLLELKMLAVILLATCTAHAQTPKQKAVTQQNKPDYYHLPYSDRKPYNILNVYLAEKPKDGKPTPLYVYAHANGGTLDNFNYGAKRLTSAGISVISWESVVFMQNSADFKESQEDFKVVMDYVIANASKYNIDTNKIVVGGSSRGSFISWDHSHQSKGRIKGVYSTGALGDPMMWVGWDPRDAIHVDSPPFIFTYPALPGDGNVHNPKSGKLIKEKYEELGIGERARVEHSLDKKGINAFEYIVPFILEVVNK
jgi:acetyl esterase/lipase